VEETGISQKIEKPNNLKIFGSTKTKRTNVALPRNIYLEQNKMVNYTYDICLKKRYLDIS
jgi:hypothetical protein